MDGLYHKYIVTKSDGSPISPTAKYFVLRLDSDPYARLALRAYADEMTAVNPKLANDLYSLLDELVNTEDDDGQS